MYYLATEDGKVFNRSSGREIVGAVEKGNNKYRKFCFYEPDTGKRYNVYTHRLVAYQHIKNDGGYSSVNHIDGDRLNNSAYNLEWCSQRQNLLHAKNILGRKLGNFSKIRHGKHTSEKPIYQVFSDGSRVRWQSATEASEKLGYSRHAIYHCLKGSQKYHKGCRWVYDTEN